MSRATITIHGDTDRQRIAAWAQQSPAGTRVEFKQTKRSIPQNDRMWAALTEVARQLPWDGQRLTPDDWKLVFLDALKRERRLVRSIEGDGFVSLNQSSSDLTKDEMSELLELIYSFGAQHGVEFGER